ncbi:hypothetical protein ACFLRI_02680 [Bacteroidota bacterium]
MLKMFLFWLAAIVITLGAAVYQRTTGPTYPKKIEILVNDQEADLKLVRSISLDDPPEVKLNIEDTSVEAKLFFRRYMTKDEFTEVNFKYNEYPVDSWLMNKVFKIDVEKGLFAAVDQQPPAGKVEYYFEITDQAGSKTYFDENPIVIRFKGAVPATVLTPHIFFMFFAMLLAVLTGILALFKNKNYRKYTFITFVLLFIGGMILGPVVQKYAFGEFWTGVPFGWDLTDNKTLIAFVFWLLAVIGNVRKERRWLSVLASVILLLVYSIPHSMFGSQLDYESGEVTQGMFLMLPLAGYYIKMLWNSLLN